MKRRTALRTVGLAGVGAIAGCTGGNSTPTAAESATDTATGGMGTDDKETDGMDVTPGDSTDSTAGQTPTDTPYEVSNTAIGDHPAGQNLGSQPVRGPVDGTAVVVFEDPSCPICRDFHEGTVPQIESKLVEPGKAGYVVRSYPVVYPWGGPATQALEATFARSESAFFSLLDHYFSNQSSFSSRNVLDKTETFLRRTDVDAAAVRADAKAKAYDGAVQTDIADAKAGGASGVTPTVFLFRNGSYVTKASGSVSYDLIAAALGV